MLDVTKCTKPLISSGSHTDREERARTLVTLFVKFLSDHVDLLVQVRQDFLDKPVAETIMGCKTFGEYCRTVLHYSESHIRRLLAGRNPASAIFDGSKNRVPLLPNFLPPLARFESGDVVLDALINEQNHTVRQISEHGDADASLLFKAAALEGKIISHIWSQSEPHEGWPPFVQSIYRSPAAQTFRGEE
jgi:hypothetical protein